MFCKNEMEYEDLFAILSKFVVDPFKVYVYGGFIRDRMTNERPTDADIKFTAPGQFPASQEVFDKYYSEYTNIVNKFIEETKKTYNVESTNVEVKVREYRTVVNKIQLGEFHFDISLEILRTHTDVVMEDVDMLCNCLKATLSDLSKITLIWERTSAGSNLTSAEKDVYLRQAVDDIRNKRIRIIASEFRLHRKMEERIRKMINRGWSYIPIWKGNEGLRLDKIFCLGENPTKSS